MNNRLDPFDELAAMFLTAPQPSPPQASASVPSGSDLHSPASGPHVPHQLASGAASSAAVRAAMVELLIVGHLPVRAGLWLVPYADALARSAGSVGLARLDGQEPSLQLLRAPEYLADAPLPDQMAHAIGEVSPRINAWVLRATEGLSADEAIDARPDRITILSSADKAAVVSAYQTIKELANAAQHPHRTLPPIGLAVVGCDAHAAATVIDRLNRTTVSFLGVTVTLSGLLPRMDASIKCTRSLTFATQERPSLMHVREWIEQASRPACPLQAAAPMAETRARVVGDVHAATETIVADAQRLLRQPSPWTAADDALASAPPQPQRPPAASQAPRATAVNSPGISTPPAMRSADDDLLAAIAPGVARLPPKVVVELEHKRGVATRPVIEPDDHGRPMPLAKFVHGLTPLSIRPPGHERIELAVDDRGILHVLARDAQLRELPVVARWAHAHRELLAMAFPNLAFKPDDAICHVFAAEPALLADLHGSDLRLHVLAPVNVGDSTAWYAAPLNVMP